MKRVFYIANAFDGSYFALTDNLDDYFRSLAAYAMNLQNSKKLNTYTFGSLEMTEEEYQVAASDARAFEQSRIKVDKEIQEETSESPDLPEQPNPPAAKKRENRPGLRLV